MPFGLKTSSVDDTNSTLAVIIYFLVIYGFLLVNEQTPIFHAYRMKTTGETIMDCLTSTYVPHYFFCEFGVYVPYYNLFSVVDGLISYKFCCSIVAETSGDRKYMLLRPLLVHRIGLS